VQVMGSRYGLLKCCCLRVFADAPSQEVGNFVADMAELCMCFVWFGSHEVKVVSDGPVACAPTWKEF
jgi:hypothetical protein